MGDTLFATFGGSGIGTYNIATNEVVDTVAIAPGEGFARSTMHSTNGIFYSTATDYFSYGAAYLYNRAGQLLDTLPTGISPEGIALDIRPGNERPYAIADDVVAEGDATSFFDVQANDFEPNGDALTTSIVVAPLQGPSSVTGSETIEFTPFTGFIGVDFLEYSICDAEYCDTARVDILVDQPFGISPVQLLAENVVVFPVPANDFVNVQHLAGTDLGTLTITDLSGNLVAQAQPNTSRTRLNVSNLAAGTYLLTIEQGGVRATQRFLKK